MAAYIPEEKIAAIRNASDIVDVVAESVSLRQAGRNYLGLCPFHAEKTPSFTVSPDKQIYYCFGCGAGGNVFSFLMKHGGMTFPEAARTLAGRYGIDLPSRDLTPREKKRLTERESILTLNGEVLAYYRRCLLNEDGGKRAMGYLMKRGMTRTTIDDHRLGFAPEGWDHLIRYLRRRKQPADLARRAGLIVPRKKGDGHYDRFRNRIMFPIFNAQNQPIGFGGRVMEDASPKYLNSPETPVYHKSRSLYGMNRARESCRESRTVYVVEGYFDLLTLHQFGITNAVATLGTSLTTDHVRLLKGFVGADGCAVLVYDSDQAGINAARRSVSVFQQGLLEARILVLPQGHDPDSFLAAHGPDDFLAAAGKAMGMFPFMIETTVDAHGLNIEGKVRIVNALKPAILAVDDPVARALRIKQLAERIGVDEAVVLQKIRRPDPSSARPGRSAPGKRSDAAPAAPPQRGDRYRLERQVLTMMLQVPDMIEEVRRRRLIDQFTDSELTEIGRAVVDYFGRAGTDVADLVSRWEDPQKKALVARLSMTDERWTRNGCKNVIRQFETSLRRRDRTLLQRIQDAERKGDKRLLEALLLEKQQQAGGPSTNVENATR